MDKKRTIGHWKSEKNAHFLPRNILASTVFNQKKQVLFSAQNSLYHEKAMKKRRKKRVFLQQQSGFLHQLLVECESFNFEKYE